MAAPSFFRLGGFMRGNICRNTHSLLHCLGIFGFAVLSGLAAQVPAQAFPYYYVNDKDGTTGSLLPSGTAQWDVNPPSGNYNGPTVTLLDTFKWDDKFPDGTGIFYGNEIGGQMQYDSASADGQGHWSHYKTTTLYPSEKTFGHAMQYVTFLGSDYNYYAPSTPIEADCSYGTSIIAVFSVDTTGKFTALPGATVTFGDRDHAGYSQTWTTAIRTSPLGQKLAWATFGRLTSPAASGDPTNPDCPYPSGLAKDTFTVQVSCPGYRTAGTTGDAAQTGLAWVGKSLIVNMQSNSADPSKASTATLGTGSGDLPTSKDGTPNVPAGTGTGGSGGSGGSGGPFDIAGFIQQLMDAVTSFFTLKQEDIDALKSSTGQLASWGPFGLPAQLKEQWDTAFGGITTADGSDPNYWVMSTTPQFTSVAVGPLGYDPKNIPTAPMPTSFVDGLFPKSFDFTPYARVILFGRFVALIALWVAIPFVLVRRFTPDLRV